MPLVIKTNEKKKAKLFTGGKPKDFVLTAANGAEIKGVISGATYALTLTEGKRAYTSTGLREVADHFAELADIMDGKIAA